MVLIVIILKAIRPRVICRTCDPVGAVGNKALWCVPGSNHRSFSRW